jgi:hypothetical protein
MKYSVAIFNKDLYDLVYNDLIVFFETSKDENLNLEFKSYVPQGAYADKEASIKKATCGLLNSEGGIIIWGAPIEVKDANGNTSAVGNLTPFTSQLDRDRLMNILSSSITPMPVGIRVQILKNPANESIFVIEVEKSIERPHQYDNKYFIRLDGQTRVAPHYLIKALMTSVEFPILRGHIRLKHIRVEAGNVLITFRKLLFNSSEFINDLNVRMRLVVVPGRIIVNNDNKGSSFIQDFPIISNGAPLMSNFILKIPLENVNNDINIMFQFGGEKSPSKISRYKYTIANGHVAGEIENEAPYLIEKIENILPSETSTNSVEENINLLLGQ